MARRTTKVETSTSTALVNWDEELAKQAQIAAAAEASAGGGQFFSIKGGQLSFDGVDFEDSQAAVVVLDSIIEKTLYEGKYDPDNPEPPTCFAFGRDEDELAPHEDVVKAKQQKSSKCSTCEFNKWGSADQGRGKACSTKRRLAMIPAGGFDKNGVFQQVEDAAHFEHVGMAFIKIPPTSINGWAAFVKTIASALKRPPHGIFTKVKARPHKKNQVEVVFEGLGKVPNNLMQVIMARHQEAKSSIEFPYSLERMEKEEPKKPASRRQRKF